MIFRRRRRDEDELDLADDQTVDPDQAAEAAGADSPEPAPTRPQGPWDVEDLPDGDDRPRVDLGGLRIPIADGQEMRVDVDNETGQIRAVTVLVNGSTLQLSAFAAPRHEGIWEEVRSEIATSLATQGGTAATTEGPFGAELGARVPGQVMGPDGRVVTALQPARFLGVDGPRWFLRGVLAGPAATDAVQGAALEEVFRGVVVVRGKDPMAVRDPLPMTLPREALDHAEHADADEQAAADAAQPARPAAPTLPQRGPEITEIQ